MLKKIALDYESYHTLFVVELVGDVVDVIDVEVLPAESATAIGCGVFDELESVMSSALRDSRCPLDSATASVVQCSAGLAPLWATAYTEPQSMLRRSWATDSTSSSPVATDTT